MTYNEAVNMLPEGAKWSSSFGYSGEGGYVEYWCSTSGERWSLSNGPWDYYGPFSWTIERVY